MDDQATKPGDNSANQAGEECNDILDGMQSLQACIANAPVSIFRLGDSGNVIDVNRQACASLGYTRDELLGKTLFDFEMELNAERWHEHRKKLKSQGTRKLEGIHRRKDGSTFPVEVIVNSYEFKGVNYSYSFVRDISEQKQAEEINKRLMRLESEALQVARLGYWEYDVTGGYFTFNDQYFALHGTTAEEAGGYQMSAQDYTQKYIHPDDAHLVQDAIQLAQQSSDANFHFQIEARILKTNGTVVDIIVWFRIEKDETGKTVKLFGVNQDITERKRAEIALRNKDVLLEETGRIAKVGGWEFDPASMKGTWTDETARIYELDPAAAGTIEDTLRFYLPESRKKIENAIQEAMKTGSPYDLELEILTARGNRKWVRTIGHTVKKEEQVLQVIGSFQDITERKRAESLLSGLNAAALAMQRAASTDEIFSTAAEHLKALGFYCSMYRINADHSAVIPMHLAYKGHAIEILETLTGFQSKNFLIPIQTIDAFWQPMVEKRTVYIGNIEQSVEQFLPAHLQKLAKPILSILGVTKTINAPLVVDNEVIGLLTVQSDDLLESDVPAITAFSNQMAATWRKAQLYEQAQKEIIARKEAEAQVRQLNEELEKRVNDRTAELQFANKELEAFAYSVSHDLRAPLRAINGYARILQEDYAPVFDDEGKRICQVISEEGSRMGLLIDNILEFSRLGRTEMQKTLVNMNTLVSSVFRELTISEDMSRIDFHKERLINTEADPNLLRQVWVNLLSNALKFSHNSPVAKIEVGSSREGDRIVYWVRDNGAGFDMRYQDKLFKVFQRLHTSNEFEGTGVGLAIVQRIIHRHGGEIWAVGKVGQGATFSFSLPKKGTRS